MLPGAMPDGVNNMKAWLVPTLQAAAADVNAIFSWQSVGLLVTVEHHFNATAYLRNEGSSEGPTRY